MALNETITISRLGYPQFIPDPNTDLSQSNLTNYTADIAAGTMVQFSFDYNWTSTTTCKITNIKWEPCRFNDNGKIIYKKASGENIVFDAEGFEKAKLNIYFGQIDDNNKYKIVNKTLNTANTATLSDNTIEVEGANYIPVSFIYSYVGTSSQATYSITIENIKILRPSKYEQNVVFNKDGLNELIDNIKKYPVTKVEKNNRYGYIKVTHGNNPDNPVDVGIQGFRYSTTNNLFCGTNFLPYTGNGYNLGELYLPLYTPDDYRTDKTYYKKEGNSYISLGNLSQEEVTNIMTGTTGQPAITPLYTTHKWKNLYLSGDIGGSSAADKIGNIYATNGNFSNKVTADTLTGNLTGGSISIGGTTTNPAFKVDSNGNVIMNGNITWGSNPLQSVYHKGIGEKRTAPRKPDNGETDFNSSDTNSDREWHTIYTSEDRWMSMTYNGGQKWNTPMRITAVDGQPGPEGGWTNENILEALEQIDATDGFFNFPTATNGVPKNKLGIKASVILAELLEANQIIMNGGSNYDKQDATKFKGGYISFLIPSPLTYLPGNLGWRGRLGYLRGNGDGNNPTAGLGIAIYADATLAQQEPNKFGNNSTAKKVHLVLSILMLTQSGLGLMTAVNVDGAHDNHKSGQTWCQNDSLASGKPHYSYRWWSGGQTGSSTNRFWRLWIHEDNGGLYVRSGDDGIVSWRWDDDADSNLTGHPTT